MNVRKPISYIPEDPQPLVRKLPPSGTFPCAALGSLRAAVEAVQGMTQAPIAIPAASALAVASLAVQGFADVETLHGSSPLSLYLLTIARSGERKSSSDALLMKALRDHEREASRDWRLEREEWQNRHALWKGAREAILGRAKKGSSNCLEGAEAELQALGPEVEEPPSVDRLASEPTFEGLTRLFVSGQPSLGIFSDEGGQFLGGHAMNSDNRQKTLSALNDLWQGNPIRRTRAGDGHSTLHGRRLAMHLMVQPVVARTFFADPLAEGSGFLARFLIAEPTSTIGTRFHANSISDVDALDAFCSRARTILEAVMPTVNKSRELSPRLLPLSSGARELLIAFSDEVERRQALGDELSHITPCASKAAEQVARLAGVLTLWADLDAKAVSEQDLTNGITLVRFYLCEAARMADAVLVSAETDRAETLRKWLQETWPYPDVTSSEVVNRGPNALREASKAHAALNLLEKYGWLTPLAPGTVVRGKSRKKAWHIVKGIRDG